MNIIDQLKETYKDNPYMLQRLNYHLTNILPKTLKNELQNWEERKERNNYLLNEQQIFIQIFLSKNAYYYLPSNNTYYEYNGISYSMIKEDDVHHQLLSSISKDRKLMQWKYKTKFIILKQIKERNLFQNIPETCTIQNVISALCPSLFADKSQVKYFLTILGDNILKKPSDLIFLVKPKMKPFLQELDQTANLFGLSNIAANIMTKYHDSYAYKNCRLLKINSVTSMMTLDATSCASIIKNLGVNLFCIAAYYSHNKYSNSDNYIFKVAPDELREYTLFLKKNTHQNIVDLFCKYAIETVGDGVSETELVLEDVYKSKVCINWKNMHYIWKLYISNGGFPNMIYSNNLKKLIKERGIQYDEITDTFYNVTSKYLPCVSDFLHFWSDTIVVLTELNTSNNWNSIFEVDELCDMFKIWRNNVDNNCFSYGNMVERDLTKILNHFFPAIEIVEGKHILNITCSIWDKNGDIHLALQSLKEINKNGQTKNGTALILIDDAYKYYLKFCRKNKSISLVNKQYFTKYVMHTLTEFIEFDTFISCAKWI